MTITFCLIPSIPLGVLREYFGFNRFPYSILNYENKLFYMKNYSYLWTISYDVIVLICFFRVREVIIPFLSFLYWGVAGSKRIEYSGQVT